MEMTTTAKWKMTREDFKILKIKKLLFSLLVKWELYCHFVSVFSSRETQIVCLKQKKLWKFTSYRWNGDRHVLPAQPTSPQYSADYSKQIAKMIKNSSIYIWDKKSSCARVCVCVCVYVFALYNLHEEKRLVPH